MVDTQKILEENGGEPYVPQHKKENDLLLAILNEHHGHELEIEDTTEGVDELKEMEIVCKTCTAEKGDDVVIIRAYND